MSIDISCHKSFWYGWKLDTCFFNFNGSTKDICLKLGKVKKELIYDSEWKYKSWAHCHNCGRNMLEKLYWSNIEEVFSSVNEEMILIWPFHDKNGEHYINICEDCIMAHLMEYVTDPDSEYEDQQDNVEEPEDDWY